MYGVHRNVYGCTDVDHRCKSTRGPGISGWGAKGLVCTVLTWFCTSEFCAMCTLSFLKNNGLKIKNEYKNVDLKKKSFRD